jgi:CheY-like chemotaxis protein
MRETRTIWGKGGRNSAGPKAREGRATGSERVNVVAVEDERFVRELIADILVKNGYKVIQAGDGATAIKIWRSQEEKFHLLLTDIIMPGNLNGRELAEILWIEQPRAC